MAAVVVGEVLLRGGEAGSVVPTKVPGNLEDEGVSAGSASLMVPHTPQETSAHFIHKEALPPSNLHGALGAGSTKKEKKKKNKAETIPPACPLLTSTAQTLETAESPCPRDSGY